MKQAKNELFQSRRVEAWTELTLTWGPWTRCHAIFINMSATKIERYIHEYKHKYVNTYIQIYIYIEKYQIHLITSQTFHNLPPSDPPGGPAPQRPGRHLGPWRPVRGARSLRRPWVVYFRGRHLRVGGRRLHRGPLSAQQLAMGPGGGHEEWPGCGSHHLLGTRSGFSRDIVSIFCYFWVFRGFEICSMTVLSTVCCSLWFQRSFMNFISLAYLQVIT